MEEFLRIFGVSILNLDEKRQPSWPALVPAGGPDTGRSATLCAGPPRRAAPAVPPPPAGPAPHAAAPAGGPAAPTPPPGPATTGPGRDTSGGDI